jgi:hypothetical protein
MFLQKFTWIPAIGGGTRRVLKDFFVGKKKSLMVSNHEGL